MGVSLDDDEQAVLLGTHGTAVLATVNDDSAPVPLPVWYVVVDGHLYVRTPRSARRLHHVANKPRVGLVVHAGEAWRDLRGMLVNGRVEVVDEEGEATRVRAALDERFAELLPQGVPARVASHYDDTVVLRIDPVIPNRSWDNDRKVRM